MPIERFDIAVDGGQLATFRLGAAPPGAPIVLAVHGITSNSRTWLAAARALGDRAALVAVDLRGRARSSELPPPYGLDAHTRDMVAVLDHFGIDRAAVCGHSLGAYIAARLATRHPERVDRLVLVDGGLEIPGSRTADPERFMNTFLSATLARLDMTFPDLPSYLDWWRRHPAVGGSDIASDDLEAYAAHDLAGTPPTLRSAVVPQAIREDGLDLFSDPDAEGLAVPTVLLCAPRGMTDDPHPMQPLADVQRWAANDPEHRRAVPVPDVNHYTIVLGRRGARTVAETIAEAVGAAT